jgi:hypothetical protein
LKPLPGVAISSTIPQRVEPAHQVKAIVAMDGVSGSHSFWESAWRDLLAGLARSRNPEFEALLTGFIAIATRLRKEFERILGEARRSRFFQDLERMRSGPPVPGYEAFLIGEGYEPFEARLMGHAVNNLGKRLAREREAERALAGVLRAAIKGEEKGPLVAARRAKALRVELASPDSWLALEKSCREAGRPELTYELERIIERVINREPMARHILVDTAKTLLSGLPDPRGRRCNIKTAKHQLLLHLLEAKKMPRAYTWNDREGECVDPAAKATRIAVGDPSFDPRYAYRDLRKRKLH